VHTSDHPADTTVRKPDPSSNLLALAVYSSLHRPGAALGSRFDSCEPLLSENRFARIAQTIECGAHRVATSGNHCVCVGDAHGVSVRVV